MSRIGKKPIIVPEGVEIKIEGQKLTVKGPKGEISRQIPPEIELKFENREIKLTPKIETPKHTASNLKAGATGQAKTVKALWGSTRALLSNMVKGVKEGYEKKLEIEGVGYRAALDGKDLVLQVGFTHPIKIKAPENINFSVESNIITISGIDKELVGQIAAKIRKSRPAEPYKGKGIKYVGEVIRKKEGKKAVATTGA